MTIGWAIVSTGRYPDVTVAPALKLAQGAELAAVYSRNRQTGEEFARKHGAAAAYDSLDDLLDDPRVEVVYICSPNQLHAEYTERAARAGKHVLVEKPMALNLTDAEAMIQICESQGVKLGVGFQLRLHPGRIETRRRVLAGELGTIALAPSCRTRSAVLSPPSISISAMHSCAPSLASRSETPRPIPDPAPVTNATFPSSEPISTLP